MIQTKQPSSKIQHGGSGNKPLWNRTSGWTPGPVATRRGNQGNITGGKKGRADTYSPRLVELEFLPETDMTTVNKLVRDFLQHIQERWRVQPVPPHPYKVTHRSQYGIKHETLPGEWHRNRRRAFLESETCGHFSPFWLPYREIGGVVFDLRKLVLDNLVPALLLLDNKSQETIKEEFKRSQKRVPRPVENIPMDMDEVTGIAAIRLSLHFINELLIAVKGRQDFSSALWELRKKEQERREAKPTPAMHAIPIHLLDNSLKRERDMSQKRQRLTTFLDKLSAIQHILNTVVNIRDRDIRYKYPFTKEAVRLLRFTRPAETKSIAAPPVVMDPFERMREIKLPGLSQVPRKIQDELGRAKPLWQDDLTATFSTQDAHKQKVEVSSEETLRHLRSSLIRALSHTKLRYLHQLRRLDRELVRRYKYTFLALSVLPLSMLSHNQIYKTAQFLESQDIKATSEGRRLVATGQDTRFSLYVLEDCKDFHQVLETPLQRTYKEGEEVAVWYQLLVEESRAAHINDEPQVQTVLQQLFQSNTTNLSGIHKPQEKLCMLVMSLHPQELCTLHWQSALKFVFEEILEGAEGTVEVWIQKRGLPLMI